MSLEAQIAALTQQAGLLMDLPQQVNAAAQAKITAMGQAYNNLISGLYVTAYVNQATGSDTAAGTVGAPFKTIDKALAITPRGGVCEVRLVGDYTFATLLEVDGRHLYITSDGPVKRALYFERLLDATSTPNYRLPASIALRNRASLVVVGLTIKVPVLDGGWSAITLAGTPGGLISVIGYNAWQHMPVTIAMCNVEIPTAPFCPIIQGAINLSLNWYSNTMTGAVTSILGRLSADQTNTAGVAANTLPWLQTNLANV